jgi:osmoprotectant transport system ATP-binding protein
MFALDRVSKRYQLSHAVERVTLAFVPRTTTVLIGPSGCGKSTLLRLLIGLILPDEGTVTFDGAPLDRTRIPGVRQRVGYVIQQGGLFPHLSARENVTLMARHLRWSERRIASRLNDLVALSHFPAAALDRYPGELSGGQNQRLGLMRALMLDPEVLLLDEPLGALDPMIRFELQEELRQVFATLGKTVIMVTHDLAEAAFLGHHIVLMRGGRVVQCGVLRDMIDAPAEPFVEQFIRAQRSHFDAVKTPNE